TATMASDNNRAIVIDPFCLRQFNDESYTGTKIHYSPEQCEEEINKHFQKNPTTHDGYASFCKHIFMPNFMGVEGAIVRITPENEALLRSGYQARTPKELAVLARWFPRGSVPPPPARYLDVILYSRDQIRKENAAMGEDCGSDAPWGVVSIKAQDVDREVPMQPITMLRNALGRDQGGSGVPLDADAYRESVAFWSEHATL
ncbi:flagellar associated protein, partial [Tribonema minus]